jgi:hypothetical protein
VSDSSVDHLQNQVCLLIILSLYLSLTRGILYVPFRVKLFVIGPHRAVVMLVINANMYGGLKKQVGREII